MPSPRLSQSICCTPCLEFGDDVDDVVVGNAYDVIVVKSTGGDFFFNDAFVATFPRRIKENYRLLLEVGTQGSEFVSHEALTGASGRAFEIDFDGSFAESNSATRLGHILLAGRNPARYLLLREDRIVGVAYSNIYLWSAEDRILVSDIDGTITRSNSGGIVDTVLTERYNHCHDAVCEFFSAVVTDREKMQVLYVTSRPIGLASTTRKFLDNFRQQNYRLPPGPVLGFQGNLAQLLIMELVSYRTHHFKAEILWKNVVDPFRKATGMTRGIFEAAFGNTVMDIQAYNMVSVPLKSTFLVESSTKIYSFDSESDDELVNLNAGKEGSGQAWRSEMPRDWYRRKMGTSFDGYGDPRLKAHILPNYR